MVRIYREFNPEDDTKNENEDDEKEEINENEEVKQKSSKKKIKIRVKDDDDDEQEQEQEKEKETGPETDKNIQDMTITELVKYHCPKYWKKVFSCKGDIRSISKTLELDEEEYGQCFPLRENIFRIFHLLAPEDVKVLIIGQDPYHNRRSDGKPAATGLAFSTWPSEKKQPSVRNIHLEVKNCYPDFEMPNHGDLTGWVEQGVMLLNTSLTVRPDTPNSHSHIWMGLTSKVVKYLVETRGKKLIVFLWGGEAKKLMGSLVSAATVFETSHPSPFSVNRGFFGCKHFKLANDVLTKYNIKPIDWSLL